MSETSNGRQGNPGGRLPRFRLRGGRGSLEPKLPLDWKWNEVAGVAVDRQDRVYVFNRGEHPVCVFDSDGTFLSSWGESFFVRPHGISIGPDRASSDEVVYCTDDLDHTVH